MATLLSRLGRLAAQHRILFLVLPALLLTAATLLALMLPSTLQSSSSIPGSPAQVAATRMDEHFPSGDAESANWVLTVPAGRTVDEPVVAAAMQDAVAEVRDIAGVSSVSDAAEMVSADGTVAAVSIDFDTPAGGDVPVATLEAVERSGQAFEDLGGSNLWGGDAFEESHPPVGPNEGIGVAVALLVLVLTFGSVLAAGLSLLTAVLGVGAGTMAILGAANLFDIADNALTLSVMLALAVGIDYALLIVYRHRRQLAAGMPVRDSIAHALGTAGSAVVFAGATVVIALIGLTVAGVPMLTSMGLASAGAVAMSVLFALTVLPALLSWGGERLRPRPGSRAFTREAERKAGVMTRWIGLVIRHPKKAIVTVVLGLGLVAAPAVNLQLALTDAGSTSTTEATRQAYDAMADAFGPGVNGPLVAFVEGGDPATVADAAEQMRTNIEPLSGVAQLSEPVLSEDGTAAVVQIVPTTGPRSAETADLVPTIAQAVSSVGTSTDTYVAVTGTTAVGIDVADKLNAALVPFASVVVGLSLLLLLVAFRSWTIPLKATGGFILSIGAAFGATVAVFQWGWVAGPLGVPSEGPVASFTPIIVMAVLFGLAMDYEVFLVSAMREHYSKTGQARESILEGGRTAGRVVVSAACIMITVFVSFLLSHDPDIMPIAFALGVGVLIDAFVVRLTLVPAVMRLLGDRAWSLPRWLGRLVPSIDVEGHSLDESPRSGPATPRHPHERTLVASQ